MESNIFVSCIMLTANRHKFIPFALQNFLSQDFKDCELIIVDDGVVSIKELLPVNNRIKYYYLKNHIKTIGEKRNFACKKTNGNIIMHWDDDDYYAPDWISKQVKFLQSSNVDICGIEHVHFYSPISDILYLGTDKNRNNGNFIQFLSGATFAYWKSYWQKHPFENLNIGEDDNFITKSGATIYAHPYVDGFVAILHPKNTTIKYFEHEKQKRFK